ncbi:MAG: hypothetical protein Unbinned2716contig1004_11 [Prokaryotic dsDNA virus sp.]|nr:MAG: hypothetical protein Unbinned2716contig1004_11 [Prokaryotic dsDNA virus sp.]|tara:strand:- start:20391 stop:20579 length:189 start_codon:yes stop_codon:yes gene_type:complete
MNCNICDSEIESNNGDVVGYFGITEVSFCIWCYSSITDMVIQIQGFDNIDILKEKIKELENE